MCNVGIPDEDGHRQPLGRIRSTPMQAKAAARRCVAQQPRSVAALAIAIESNCDCVRASMQCAFVRACVNIKRIKRYWFCSWLWGECQCVQIVTLRNIEQRTRPQRQPAARPPSNNKPTSKQFSSRADHSVERETRERGARAYLLWYCIIVCL